ncbi:MAG: hypothetical protein PVJ21_07240 [Anaerolineales bacterium]|jgi:hypothetical protein
MSYTFPVPLGQVDEITERPFTHTDHISKDREVLVHMARQLGVFLEKYPDILEMSESIYIDESEGHSHRYFVPRVKALTQTKKVYLVGFFSHKQEGAPSNHFGNLDEKLIKELPTHQEILSYSTMGLPNGDFGNLVLLSNEEAKTKWMQGKIHNRAVELSPDYYQYVRINNGVLPEGIMKPDLLQITRVKYYDYSEDPSWKAVRKLTQG